VTTAAVSARTTLQEYRDLARMIGVSPWPPPAIFVLGVISAALEVLAITLVVTMLFALMAQPVAGGLIGHVVGALGAITGEGWGGLAIAVLLLVALKGGVAQLYMLLTIRSKNRINAAVMTAAHARLVDMPFAQLRAQGQGELINTTASDTWQMANAVYLITRIAINLCMIAIFSLFISALSWQIALMAFTGGAAIAFFGQLISRSAREHGMNVRKGIEALYTRLLAAVHGARLIRAFAQEEGEKERVTRAVAQLRKDTMRAESTQSLAMPINEIGYLALLIGIIAIAAQLGVAQAAAFTAIALLYRMAPQVRELESNRLMFASLYAPLHGVTELVRIETPRAKTGAQASADGLDAIKFENVSFQPAGATEPVLSNVSFEIPAGRVTALLGPSGAGKTSVVNLLLRLYSPDAGTIWIGSQKLDDIQPASWLTQVGAAGQDLDVVEGTIAENLRLGAPAATDAELRVAARDACALSFIESLPNGFDTWVGTFGYNLSGGQRQRISLARALLRKPKLLLLDESTSAVESDVEGEILATVINQRTDLTILLITHRLNRSVRVDHVVRLERGEVVAEGDGAHHAYPLEERGA
jgi:ABC-type multidrug transport system fused ATPase/permease subunit